MDSKAGSSKRPAVQAPLTCPRCGVTARRAEARFCFDCGQSLDETYLPADALRASYSLDKRRIVSRRAGRLSSKPLKNSMSLVPVRNNNGASTTGLAFVTYAIVPYLGILFCPGAILMGSVGLYSSYRAPERGGRRDSFISVAFGLLIFSGQILLWWILYKMPEWAGRF